MKYLAKKGWDFGKNFLNDLSSGEEPKSSMKKNLKRVASETLDDISSSLIQRGKRRRKSNKKVKRKVTNLKKKSKRRNKRKKTGENFKKTHKKSKKRKIRIKNYFK